MLSPPTQLALVAVLLGGGAALERHAGLAAVRRALPSPARFALEAAAFGAVWVSYFLGLSPETVVDDSVLALAAFVALRVCLPLLVRPFVTPRPRTPC